MRAETGLIKLMISFLLTWSDRIILNMILLQWSSWCYTRVGFGLPRFAIWKLLFVQHIQSSRKSCCVGVKCFLKIFRNPAFQRAMNVWCIDSEMRKKEASHTTMWTDVRNLWLGRLKAGKTRLIYIAICLV